MVIDPGGPSQNKGSIINSTSGSKSRAVSSTPSSVPAAHKPGPSLADSVSLSSRAQTLVKLEGKISQAPDVDRQKVESIKLSIAEGRYTIDPHKVAAAILAEDDNNP